MQRSECGGETKVEVEVLRPAGEKLTELAEEGIRVEGYLQGPS